MTERDRLAALVRAAGLRIGRGDLELLVPAWTRYQALLEALRQSFGEEWPD